MNEDSSQGESARSQMGTKIFEKLPQPLTELLEANT